MSLHPVRFPNETADYRVARDELLRAEMDLRNRVEEVAAMRRRLPVGGAVREDYVFEEGGDGEAVRRVRLSDLFVRREASLLLYNFMYGPTMAAACPMCTSFLDSLDGIAPHVMQRANLVVVAKSPIQRLRAHARERSWRHLRLLSSAGSTFNRDYFAENPDESQNPLLHVFARRGLHHPPLLHDGAAVRADGARPAPAAYRPDVAALEPPRRDARGPRRGLVPEAQLRAVGNARPVGTRTSIDWIRPRVDGAPVTHHTGAETACEEGRTESLPFDRGPGSR